MTTLFRLKIDPKERQVARFFGIIERAFQKAFVDAKKERKITQQQLATLLGVDRSVINRRLLARENMTQRTLAEMAWAMGYEINLELTPKGQQSSAGNHFVSDETRTIPANLSRQIKYANTSANAGELALPKSINKNVLPSLAIVEN